MSDNPPAGWLVNVLPLAAPTPLPQAASDDAKRLWRWYADTWTDHVAPVTPADGDREDFIEQAARLAAALATFPLLRTWVKIGDRIVNADTGAPGPEDISDLAWWGTIPLASPYYVDSDRAADRYAATDTFANANGRRAHLVEAADVPAAVADARAHSTSDRVWVKVARAKYGIHRLHVPAGATVRSVDRELPDALQWARVHLDGDPAFLVYPDVPMSFEYRMFVVGGQLTTGAGCIEAHTPLDNLEPFNPVMRDQRSAPDSPLQHRPDLVERYRAFAEPVARSLAAEGIGACSLDVAESTDGRVLMIEANGILNSGLYACDPARITAAAALHPELFAVREVTANARLAQLVEHRSCG